MLLVTARQPRTELNLEGFGLIGNSDKVGGDPQKVGVGSLRTGRVLFRTPASERPAWRGGLFWKVSYRRFFVQVAKKRTGRERDVMAERAGGIAASTDSLCMAERAGI